MDKRLKILKKAMSAEYAGHDRYYYLDPEEVSMILTAMEIYKQTKSKKNDKKNGSVGKEAN